MATIKDIAKHAGVSVATVSYVLNNTRFVSEEKRRRILLAIEELKYVPNAVARSLRIRESKAISLVVSDITNPFYPDLAKACEDVAHHNNYTVNIINTNDQHDRLQRAAFQLKEGKIDGMVITTALEQDRYLIQELLQERYPIVLTHRRLGDLNVDMVSSDNERGAWLATNHSIKLGHKNIALMTGVNGSSVSFSRLTGYMRAMQEAGLRIRKDWVVPGGARYEPSLSATRSLLKLPLNTRPTAILNISDIGALAVLDVALEMKLKVPDQLAVIGFDDLFISSSLSVQLSTIKIPRYELGKLAVEMLIERISKAARISIQ